MPRIQVWRVAGAFQRAADANPASCLSANPDPFLATCGFPTRDRFGRQAATSVPQPSPMAGAALTRYDDCRERAGEGDEEALQSRH
jgi:hypothetical protein